MDDPTVPGVPDDPDATRDYLDQIRALHRDWDELESRGDSSVQLSDRVRTTLSEAVRADARHGARVQMPPTEVGPYTLSELALRSLIRDAVDAVPGVLSLRTAVDFGPGEGLGSRGLPERVEFRVSLSAAAGDLTSLADRARESVRSVCLRELDLHDPVVDIHIEDLHDI